MNHSPTHGSHIRRIRIRPTDISALTTHPQDKRRTAEDANPFIIRRTYDITAACTRLNTEEGEEPLSVHIRGERATPLLRCAVIGAAAVGIAVSAAFLYRMSREWQIRRKYARRYAERLRQQRLRMQMQYRHGGAPNAPDAKK